MYLPSLLLLVLLPFLGSAQTVPSSSTTTTQTSTSTCTGRTHPPTACAAGYRLRPGPPYMFLNHRIHCNTYCTFGGKQHGKPGAVLSQPNADQLPGACLQDPMCKSFITYAEFLDSAFTYNQTLEAMGFRKSYYYETSNYCWDIKCWYCPDN